MVKKYRMISKVRCIMHIHLLHLFISISNGALNCLYISLFMNMQSDRSDMSDPLMSLRSSLAARETRLAQATRLLCRQERGGFMQLLARLLTSRFFIAALAAG